MLERFGGRKFILTIFGSILLTIIPVLYSKSGVDSVTTQIVLAAIASALGVYGASNVISKKYSPKDFEQSEKEPGQ